jgi:hypothetical protein
VNRDVPHSPVLIEITAVPPVGVEFSVGESEKFSSDIQEALEHAKEAEEPDIQ